MLLTAAPEEIRKDLVASRSRSSLELLARLMVLYRPGSTMEKSRGNARTCEHSAGSSVSFETMGSLLPESKGLEAEYT